jgi:uncharacterized protein (TIGR03437 family)
VITTIAGGDSVFTASGQPAVSVPLGYINGVAIDGTGNVYFTDPLDHLVLRVSPGGVITVIAGNGIAGYSGDGGPATAAAIAATDSPDQYIPLMFKEVSLGGIAVDPKGNVLFGDSHRVRMISTDGTINTVAGGGTNTGSGAMQATSAALGIVTGLALDSSGNLYFCESNRIRKMTPAGVLTTFAGTGIAGYSGDGGQATAAQLWQPMGVAFDSQGNLFVADGDSLVSTPVIRQITPAGVISTIAGGGNKAPANGIAPLSLDLPEIGGLAVGPSGNLYAFGGVSGTLIEFSGTAANPFSTTTLITNPVNAPFSANVPASTAYVAGQRLFDNSGIAFDNAGNLFVADSTAGYLCKIDAQGFLRVVAGNGNYGFSGDGGPAVAAVIQSPGSMTQTPDGTIYFVDSLNNRIRGISPSGTINTVLSGANFPPLGVLEAARAVASDSNSNLYVLLIHRLIQLGPDGTITILLNSTGTFGDSGDGGPALQARIQSGVAMARDSKGNLYIVDSAASRIREITTDGKIHTIAGNGTRAFTPDGAVAANSPLSDPSSILLDGLGGIYFEEARTAGVPGTNILRYITPGGILKTIAGIGQGGFSGDGGPATQAAMFVLERAGIALDKSGNLYFSDSLNSRVRVISPAGTMNTVVGNGQSGNTGDGGAPLAATLVAPQGLLIDAKGDLLISDIAGNRIRAVLATPPSISIAPLSMNFSARSGGQITAPKTLSVTSAISGLAFSLELPAVNWLVTGASGGATPQLIEIRANPATLSPGAYTASILIHSPLAGNPDSELKITLQVGPANLPVLAVDRAGVSFTYPKNPTTVESRSVKVSNTGSGPLIFAATAQADNGRSWLAVTPASGTVTPANPASLSITADATGLDVGTYTGIVTIASSTTGTSSIVRVTLTISSLDQAIQLSQPGLSFIAVANGGVAPPSSFKVNNIGRGTMNFTVSTRTLSGGPWLAATPASGAATPTRSPSIAVSVNPAGLSPGFYYGQVQIDAANAANTPHRATIAMQVLPSDADPGPIILPSDLVVRTTQGAPSPGAIDVYVYNLSSAPQTFVARVASSAPEEAFLFIPQQGTVAADQPAHLVLQPLTGKLSAGVYEAELTLQFSDGNVRRVGIRTVVAPEQGQFAGVFAAQAHDTSPGCLPSQLVPVVTVLGQSFSVPAAWPVALETTVTDDCGNPLQTGSVTATFTNGDPPLSLEPNAGDGTWSATWVSGNTSGPVTVTVTASDQTRTLTGTRAVSGALGNLAPAPVISAVVNSASFVQNVPLAPGSIVSIGGTNLSNGTGQAASIPLGSTLADSSVLMSSTVLPLYYSSSGLINAVSPGQISVNTSHQVLVARGSALSVPVLVDVGPADPAIFPYPSPGDPASQGAIVNPVNYAVAQPGSPVTAGDAIAIFCTGLGAVDQKVSDGAGAPFSPVADTVVIPTVTIGGQSSKVFFSGLTPGSVGLYQINATVPSGVTPGDAVPVVISIDGRTGPSLTIAVK